MSNIFIQLKSKVQFKRDPLLKILDIDPQSDNMPKYIDHFFNSEEEHTEQDNYKFILTLISKHQDTIVKDKLYALLVFYASRMKTAETSNIVDVVVKSNESIVTKVKFFSLLYKSVNDNELKKRLLSTSIGLIEKENKIAIFSNFVENFDSLMSTLTFNHNEYVKIYVKLINYLEKHIVYKKLWKHSIIECLAFVTAENAQTEEVTALVVKLIQSTHVAEETIRLLHQEGIKNNKLYPYLQALLVGDFQTFGKLDQKVLIQCQIKPIELARKVKIQAIPRILSSNSTNVQVVSYQQVSQILKVEKDEVEGYIIQAIQEDILKAKIDQFSETIIINSVKFRTLRGQEGAALQKNLTLLAGRLQQLASR